MAVLPLRPSLLSSAASATANGKADPARAEIAFARLIEDRMPPATAIRAKPGPDADASGSEVSNGSMRSLGRVHTHTFSFAELGIFGLHGNDPNGRVQRFALAEPDLVVRSSGFPSAPPAQALADSSVAKGSALESPDAGPEFVAITSAVQDGAAPSSGSGPVPGSSALAESPSLPSETDAVPQTEAPSERVAPDSPARPPNPVNLVLAESGDGLVIATRSPDFTDGKALRAALERVAAEFELGIGELHLNGATVPALSKGGSRGGFTR